MKFACPGCAADMAATPPKPGRFTLKCPKCAVVIVLKATVDTLAAEKAAAEREKSLIAAAERSAADFDRTNPSAAGQDPDQTNPSVAHRSAVDPDQTNPSMFRSAAKPPTYQDDTEATRGAVPRADRNDQTMAAPNKPAPPEEKGKDADGNSFRGYEVLKRLGKGGMGSVYLARQVSLDRTVALKTLNPELAADAAFVSRFVREAYAAAQLTHHNVVQIYELGRDGAVNYFSMEYVHGGSLGDRLRKAGTVPPAEAVGYVVQAANGLRFAHDRGMVHRDIKPDNLMVNDEGIVKVADLGLVKTKGVTAEDDAAGGIGKRSGDGSGLGSIPDITRVGSAMGSPSYMAPEQCRDATSVDARADIYSLGCTLYALLAGKAPFQGKTAVEVITKHLTEPPPPLVRVAPDVPKELSGIVERTLAKDPAKRFQTMTEFVAALKGWQQGQGGTGRPTEEQLAAFEGLVKRASDEPMSRLADRVARFGPLVGVGVGLLALVVHPLTGGVILLANFAACLSGFVTGGLLTGSHLFRKAREWAFGARLTDWLTVGAGVLLFVVGLFFSGLLVFGIVGMVLGAAAGIGYAYGLAKPAHAKQTEVKDELESLVKRWRLAGMDEDDVRAFVVENAGDRWERVYELLYGYPAKLLARTEYAEQVSGRPKYAGWRDAVVARIDAAIRQRADARAKKVLRQAELARLKAEGMAAAEAAALAEDAADDVVEQGKEIRAANADREKKVNVGQILTRYEIAKAIPRRPRTPLPVRIAKKVIGLPFDPRLRLLVGAALVVGGLMWVNQATNGGVENLRSVPKDDTQAAVESLGNSFVSLALNPEQVKPLSVGWLPKEVGGFFDTLNPIVAGLLVLLTGFTARTRTVLVVALGAAVAFAGHKVGIPIPEVGPLKPSHLAGLGGLAIGLVGFVVLWRK